MNSTEQELPANKEKEESPLATTDTTDVFKPPDENKESGDTETKINDDDLKTNYVDSKLETDKEIPEEVALKQADLNKSSEFDDDDDFNSEEMRLRWDDDDDEINDEKSNNELNESFSKESESNTPSLVTAVKELENALEETTSEDVKNSEADHDLVDPEGSSSKDLLEDIDKLIGNDDTAVKQVKSNSEKDNGDITISNENDVVVSKESDETDNLKINDNSDIKLDVSSSDGSTNIDINSKSNNLDESIESDQMINENSILSSTVNDSILEGNSKFEHGLKRPDMMLEIPTQEIIDCLDDFDSVESLNASDQIDSMEKDIDSKVESLNASDQIDSMEKDIDSKNLDDKIKLIDQDISDHVSELTEKYLKAQSSEIEMKSQQSVENIFMTEKDEVEDNVIVDSIKVDNDVEMCDVSKNGNKDAITFKTSSPVQDPVTEVEEIKASENNPICEKPATAQILENKGEEKQTSIKPLNEDLNNQTNEKLDEKAPENIDNDVTQSLEPVSTESSDKTSNKVIEGILTTSDDIPTTAVEPKADTEQPSKDLENNEPKSISKDPLLSTLSEIKDNTELASENVELKGATDSVDEEPNISSVLDQKSISKNTTDLEQKAETTPILDQSEQSDVDTNIGTTVKLDQPKEAKDTNNTKPISEQPSTSKMVLENQVDKEHKKETSAENPTDKEDQDQLPDTTDEVPEMEDTLGLLAESSRVVEDAEASSGDGDEDDDDEDFDPDDESSNQVSAYQSEESNAQPDKEDPQTGEKKEKKDFFSVTSVTCEDGAKDDDLQATAEDADKVPDVTAVPEEDTVATSDTATEVNQDDVETAVTKEQPKFLETAKLFATSDEETEKAASILKDLLLKDAMPPVEAAKTSADNGVVDLESSSEEDVQQKKEETTKKSELDAVEKEETKPTQEDTKTVSEKKGVGGNSEVFNLDSDEDDIPAIANEVVIEEKAESNKCINPSCPSGPFTPYVLADVAARAYFDANKKKKYKVCTACAEAVAERTKGLVSGIKGMTPLLELDLRKVSSDTVEISDSDSDDGESESVKPDVLGESGAKFLEENLADVINETWIKYKLDERLGDAQKELTDELAKLEEESKEIDTMLNECQVATDLLRNQLYATFEPERRELTAIFIIDTPTSKSSYCENSVHESRLKRKASTSSDQPTKKAAIPLGYTPIESDTGAEKGSKQIKEDSTADDDKDVSVVKLSAEAAPSDLPPPGEISRPQLRAGMSVFAMRNSFCTWLPGKIIDVHPKNPANPFTMCRVRFEVRNKVLTRILAARCLAYIEPADVRLTIGTRVIALSKENAKTDDPTKKKSFYSGIVAEIPNPVNNYRYLIFFDHGYAQYVQHRETRVVCESASLVWEEVHPNSREFVKQYLLAYPERPMVRLHAGQSLKTEWNGKWWVTKVLQVDASLVEVSFEDNRSEWIYRGSTRLAPLFLELQAAERQRARPLPRSNQRRMNMPYVEYTRSDEQNKPEAVAPETTRQQQQQNDELRRQRAVAKKSTSAPAPPPATHHNLDSVTSRVVYYTPKNAVKPHKLSPHACSPKCRRGDTLALKDLRTYNPLAKPLLSGWERQIVRFKGHKEVMYRAPCGRRLRSMRELHRYLRLVQSDMGVDLFDFGANTHCLAEFVLNKCLVGKKDLSHGKENVPVPCVNYYDESLPEFCSYNTERTPTAGVPLNLDPDFLCGCDCTDDCEDKSKCACWKMTLEGARTIGLQGPSVGYEYKRLQEPLPSGIYECNSRCKCKHTCLNRVAQHPLQLKLQVFKTMNRGWGIRALNDVPKGSFLCVYAGNLLTDATANLDGLNEGDEYLAELDYIEVVEQMKEGYEEDIPEADKKLDRKSSKSSSQEEESSSEEESANKNDKMDDDFQPGSIGLGLTEFNKRLRKRDRTRKGARDRQSEKGKEIDKGMEDDGCITISDDEEAKEPTRFMVQAGIGGNEFVSKYRSVRSLFGKDEACYIMDAKVQGNIGRYLNHSCTPNVFVQNVFVDTHDPRFPWVAFFALSHIRAGTELTWNYNYDVGSVPGKVLYCYCGAPNCRGRLL